MLVGIIRNKFNQARKEQNTLAKSTFESVIAKITNAEKSGKCSSPLSDDVVIGLVQKEVKELEETRTFYAEGTEKYNSLSTQINYLTDLLPPAMTDEEIISTIQSLIPAIGPNKGKLIGATIKEISTKYIGKAFDKSKVSHFVDNYIQKI